MQGRFPGVVTLKMAGRAFFRGYVAFWGGCGGCQVGGGVLSASPEDDARQNEQTDADKGAHGLLLVLRCRVEQSAIANYNRLRLQ